MTAARACVALAMLAACRGESRERPAPAPAATEPAPDEPGAAGGAGPEPAWVTRVPATPGMPVLEAAEGPVLAGDLVLVASSSIGFAAVERATGAVRWQRRGEEQPQRPIARGDLALLPGRCAAEIDDAPPSRPVAGCVEEVALASGELARRRWVIAPGPTPRPRVLGAVGDALIWGADGVVWIDRGDPVVIATHAEGATPLAVTLTEAGALVVWRDAIETVVRGEAGGFEAGTRRELPDRILRGVTDPVAVGEVLALVVDDVLQGWHPASGQVAWRASARMSYAPGSVVRRDEIVRAVALDGGLHVVDIDPARGAIVREGERRPALQASSARFDAAGGLMVAVRPSVSLLRDQVMAFDADGRHRWTWDVPVPTAARLDPVGVDGDERDVFVFYDGRELARLGVAAP